MINQEFNKKSELVNTELKWVKWWGQYSITNKYNDMTEYLSVIDNKIYFNDGHTSKEFKSNDEAIIEATRIINNQ